MYVNFPKGKKLLLQQQLMSDLPEAQSALFDAPFNHTEVDYFDPITIKKGKWTRASTGTEERYGVILTWLTYRAIHAELADDLSTDSFIMALQIFTSRRGYSRSMITVKILSEQIES